MLSGKVAVLFGGGSGLGRAAAIDLAAHGATVVICALTPDRIGNVAAEITGAGGTVMPIQADARSEEDVARVFTAVKERFGRLDVLVCGVGEGLIKSTVETELTNLQKVLVDNVHPVYLTNREALRIMVPQGSGLIVNISSRAATVGGGGAPISVYAAGKSAVAGFTAALRREVKSAGVNVICLAPGPMDTPTRWRSTPDFDRRRALKPDSVAGLITYFALHPDVAVEHYIAPVSLSY